VQADRIGPAAGRPIRVDGRAALGPLKSSVRARVRLAPVVAAGIHTHPRPNSTSDPQPTDPR
jgi:hypothetical protein